jgi:hypothetical protein
VPVPTVVVVFVVVGYGVAWVPMRRCRADVAGYRRSLWVGLGSRDGWMRGIECAYLALGWPALVVAIMWLRSPTRRVLAELRDDLRAVQREPERMIARA